MPCGLGTLPASPLSASSLEIHQALSTQGANLKTPSTDEAHGLLVEHIIESQQQFSRYNAAPLRLSCNKQASSLCNTSHRDFWVAICETYLAQTVCPALRFEDISLPFIGLVEPILHSLSSLVVPYLPHILCQLGNISTRMPP